MKTFLKSVVNILVGKSSFPFICSKTMDFVELYHILE